MSRSRRVRLPGRLADGSFGDAETHGRPSAGGGSFRAYQAAGAATKPGPTTRLPIDASYLDAAQSLIDGKTGAAKDQLKQIVEKHRNEWMDPVYIAAEADYARLLKAEPKKKKKKK